MKNEEQFSFAIVILFFFIPDILSKVFSFILTQLSYIVVFVYKLLCFVRFFIIKIFFIRIDKQKRTIGTVKSLWLILNWGIISALCLSYVDILFFNSYSTRVIQLFTFVIGVIIIPMLVSSIITIKNDNN